jgi:hypothetical protein
MLNTIQFLETLGSQASASLDYEAAVAELQVSKQERDALLDRNHAALNDVLGGRAKMFFGIMAPHEEPEEEEVPFEDVPDEGPSESTKLS